MKPGLLAIAAACGVAIVPRANALPTMIRLGYTNCAACHIAPQGAGLLNAYGRGIDEAQSLRAGEYQAGGNRVFQPLSWGGRITQDFRFVGQETVSSSTGQPVFGVLRTRFMYRNATELGGGFRFSAAVVGETASAARPNVVYDPPAAPTQVYVTHALLSYRPTRTLEFSAGRDQLPSGVNLPDLGMYIRARNQFGYYDAPTQVKVFWWGKRYHINPYAFGPGGNERSGFHESGGGGLAEFDVLGHQRTIVGVNALRGVSRRMNRTMVGPYARLGFGRWGVFAEHDVTLRQFEGTSTAASFRQDATYAQVFVAVREWLVPSLGFERLKVEKPYAEHLVAPRFELSCRLSSQFSVGLTGRIERNVLTARTAPSLAVQLAMKTVN
jgi:hypothetical protein